MSLESLSDFAEEQLAREPDLLSLPAAGPAAARGGALRMGSFAVGSLFSVGAAALMFRHLGVVDTGRYTALIALGAVITGFTDFGLNGIGLRELVVLRGAQRAQLARNLLGIRLALTAVGVILITAFAFVAYGSLLGLGMLITGCGVLAQNTQTTLAVPLFARLRLGWVSALDLLRQCSAAVMIALLVVTGAHLLAFLAVTIVAALIVLPPTIALVRGDIPIMPSFDTRQWRKLVGPVLAYSMAVVTATLYLRVAIVLVSLIASAKQLGYFSVSYRVVDGLLAFPALLVSSALPIFARAAHDDPVRLGYALSRVFEVSLIVGVWISLALVMSSTLAVEVIGGAKFHAAAAVLGVQSVAVGAVFVSTVWAYGLLSLHLHRVILFFNLALLGLVTTVVAVLTWQYGALGAAIGIVAVELVNAVGGALLLVRGRPHLRPSLQLLPKVAAGALIAASPILLTGLAVPVRLLLSTGIYLAVLLVAKAYPAELTQLLRPARGRS